MSAALPRLPALSSVLGHPRTEHLLIRFGREHVVQGCRDILDELDRTISSGHTVNPDELLVDTILARLESRIATAGDPRLQRVVNATGTVLHAHLGGAPLCQAAVDALVWAATHPVNLEYDLTQGQPGSREQAVEDLLMRMTGSEAATVVNNDAAAVLLALNTLASGKEVIVSRAELAESAPGLPIGDIVSRAGIVLVPVGTDTRTDVSDYASAITGRTAVLLELHGASGGTADSDWHADLGDLVALGRKRGLHVMDHLGSGALIDLTRYGLAREPVIADRVALGADIVTSSAEQVMGGPEAGLLVGGAALVHACRTNPLHRILRCDKLTIAAVEATLRVYRESATIADDIPVLRAFTRPLAEIEDVARRALAPVASALGPGFRVSVQDVTSPLANGVTPVERPSKALVIEHDFLGPHRIAGRFRQARPPIVGRIQNEWFVLDGRTIWDPLELVPNWTDELEGPDPLRRGT